MAAAKVVKATLVAEKAAATVEEIPETAGAQAAKKAAEWREVN